MGFVFAVGFSVSAALLFFSVSATVGTRKFHVQLCLKFRDKKFYSVSA